MRFLRPGLPPRSLLLLLISTCILGPAGCWRGSHQNRLRLRALDPRPDAVIPPASPDTSYDSTAYDSATYKSGASSESASDSAYGPGASTYLLDQVKYPADLKHFDVPALRKLSEELRWDIIRTVSRTGGHLSASLGVVELTVALHHIFDTPHDRIVWDVSHQAYAHKILTGRRHRMSTIRQKDGLSGFCKRSESVYDAFGAGHSSTSISAVQGMAVGQSLQRKRARHNIAVIGDGALTGGMAYEAMNNCGYLHTPVLVILNDNGQVSLPTGCDSAGGTKPAGALSGYTARLLSSKPFKNFREVAKGLSRLFPAPIQGVSAKLDEYARGIVSGEKATLFEELGFYYIGPVDGHDLGNLIPILRNLKDNAHPHKPVLLHLKTEKGRGYVHAETAADKMHGVTPFDIHTGRATQSSAGSPPSFTKVFSQALIQLAKQDTSIAAVTAAMPGGTGIGDFGKEFPVRTFDVGIAEQHAVTFAAGLAVEGLKPFCAIYSTFLQRAYDQVVHDVVLQKLPVRFIIDRAGLVGADGATHQGSFDLAYLGTLPDLVIMAPSDEIELKRMLKTSYMINDGPSAIRFPRGSAYGSEVLKEKFGYTTEMLSNENPLPVGKGRIVKEAKNHSSDGAPIPREKKVALLSIGTRLSEALDAARSLEREAPEVGVTVADARFMRPLDIDLIRSLVSEHRALVTIEEGAIGGFGDHVLHFLSLDGLLDHGFCKFRPLVLPDHFIEASTQKEQYEEAGLNAPHIVNTIKRLLDMDPMPILLR